MLAAIGEPTRFRIVQLLAASPRTVGEVARLVDARQPQATRHLQALEAAGVVEVHALGRRRVVALRREAIGQLAAWLGSLADAHPSEPVLEQYERAIGAAERRLAANTAIEPVHIERLVPAPPAAAWRAFTQAGEVGRWWAPPHLWVAECEVEPTVGGVLRVVLAEADGARHVADGSFLALEWPRALSFELTARGPDGAPIGGDDLYLQARASLGRRVQKSQEMLAALEANLREQRRFTRTV